MKKLTVEITTIESMLGMSPAKDNIYREFIGSKAPDAASVEDEVAALGVDAVADKGMTIWPKDEDGNPFMWDYQLKGYMKDVCKMLQKATGTDPETGKRLKGGNESSKLKAYKQIIDGTIFVFPRRIKVDFNNDELGVCERPLRAMTMQGERVALASSEEIPAGAKLTFDVLCLADENIKAVREWLDYGFLRGLGQWRNSGKGRFVWREIACVDADPREFSGRRGA